MTDDEIMLLVAIVKALAESHPYVHGEDMWHWCALCDARLPVRAADHDPDCPYRMAKELFG